MFIPITPGDLRRGSLDSIGPGCESCFGSMGAAHTVYSSAGWSRCGAEKQPGVGCGVGNGSCGGACEELPEVGNSPVDVSPNVVWVVFAEIVGVPAMGFQNPVSKARSESLNLGLNGFASVLLGATGNVAIGPAHLFTLRGAGAVEQALLRQDHEGLVCVYTVVGCSLTGGYFFQGAAEMNRAGLTALGVLPRNGAI